MLSVNYFPAAKDRPLSSTNSDASHSRQSAKTQFSLVQEAVQWSRLGSKTQDECMTQFAHFKSKD